MTTPPPDTMGDDTSDRDDELLALLGQALAAGDPPPAHVLDGAKAAYTWRTIDAELAELVFDSARELTGVRSEDVKRQVTFEAPGIEIEVMVVDEVTRRLVGQLIPPQESKIELVSDNDVSSMVTDHLGRFAFDDVALGPVRLVVKGDDDRPLVQTEWVLF